MQKSTRNSKTKDGWIKKKDTKWEKMPYYNH